MENLRWLGLFADEPIGCQGDTSTAMMIHLMQRRLALPKGQRDMVVLVHDLDVEYPENGREAQRIKSTMVVEGQADGFTAMARTVGLPVAVIARMLLRGEISLTGTAIPTHPSIVVPALREIERAGLKFTEKKTTIESIER
jgi:saccharopine dehydrogenase-like NADP-dependent oxidoreductase